MMPSRWVRIPSPVSTLGGAEVRAEWVDLSIFGALVVAASRGPRYPGGRWAPWCVVGIRHGADATAGYPNVLLAFGESTLELEELVEGWLNEARRPG